MLQPNILFKKIAESPRTYNAYKAIKEEWQQIIGNTEPVFANDGTTEVIENAKNKIATITVFDKEDSPISYSATYDDAKAAKAQEEARYKVTLKETDGAALEKDLKKVKFCFWLQNSKGETIPIDNPKKVITITKNTSTFSKDSTTDILELKNSETLTNNLKKAYYYATIEYTETEAILKIKWSKWLDHHFIRVEAYQKQINIKADGGKTTASRYVKANPEIIKGFWANDNKDSITHKEVGYKDTVYMCLKTLGMHSKTLNMALWEDDYDIGDEQIETEDTAFEVTNRYTYKKLELPEKADDDYKKQRGSYEGDQLELYFKLPQETKTIGYKEEGYARNLKLITHEKLTTAYFATESKREQIEDSTLPEPEQTPAIHAVRPRETLTNVAEHYGLDVQKLVGLNNRTPTDILTYGTSVKLKTDEEIAADKKAKKDRAKKRENAKIEPTYQRIDSASLGSEVWVIVESANLQGKKATIQVHEKDALLAEEDTALTLLKEDTEVTKLENVIFNEEGIAKVKVRLRKKSDEDFKKQKEKFKVEENEEAIVSKLYLKVSCTGDEGITHKVEFLGEDEFELDFSDWSIEAHLWNDRKEMGYGILLLKGGEKEIWRTIIRAQGFSGKIGKSRIQIYADTPTGTYKFEQWRNDGSSTIYGSNSRLDMTYESGEAKSIGREEIQIHGGRQANSSNPYLWNTGGCLRVFDDAIVLLKKYIESIGNSDNGNFIEVGNTLKYHNTSKKYYAPIDYEELLKNPNNNEILKKGIIHKKYYRNESNYYTNNLTD